MLRRWQAGGSPGAESAGAISATFDTDATALALSLMNEQLLLEMICRNEASPEEYAHLAGPIWEAALFGRPNRAEGEDHHPASS